MRCGSSAISVRRSADGIADQLAISASVRPQPRQSPLFGSITQTAMHGVSGVMGNTDEHFHGLRKLRHSPVPAPMIGLWRGRLRSPLTLSGWSGGASWAIGASAVITRSGG